MNSFHWNCILNSIAYNNSIDYYCWLLKVGSISCIIIGMVMNVETLRACNMFLSILYSIENKYIGKAIIENAMCQKKQKMKRKTQQEKAFLQ